MIQNTTYGYYRLAKGDTARTVAVTVYGDGNRYHELLQANPSKWEDGAQIQVPNVRGRLATIDYDGESPQSVIRRMFPEHMTHLFLNKYFDWNGGEWVDVVKGDLVFVPS
jgi:hypothetical protein